MSGMDVDESQKKGGLQDASSPEVVEKYKAAGLIANRVLFEVLSNCVPGKKVVELCELGDQMITDEVSKIYPEIKKQGAKGIAFPTCLSINEVAGHFSPYTDSDPPCILELGDMIKVDLGVHIDGFPAVVAHTIVLGEIKGRKADAIAAAWAGSQATLRLLRAHNKNAEITEVITKSSEIFKCEPMDSVLSHEMRQYVIDHENSILGKETPERKNTEFEFEHNQVYGIDVMMSTGKGKASDRGDKCTVHKRNVEIEAQLKMKTARELLKEINRRFPTFPFSMRAFEGNRAKLGITECRRSNLVQPYPVLSEKQGEFVAQFKYTAIIAPQGTMQITGLPLDMSTVETDTQIAQDPQLQQILESEFTGEPPSFYQLTPTQDWEALQKSFNQSNQPKPKAKQSNKPKSKSQQGGGRNQKGGRNNNNNRNNKNQNQKGGRNQQSNQNNKNKAKNTNQNNKQKQTQKQGGAAAAADTQTTEKAEQPMQSAKTETGGMDIDT